MKLFVGRQSARWLMPPCEDAPPRIDVATLTRMSKVLKARYIARISYKLLHGNPVMGDRSDC